MKPKTAVIEQSDAVVHAFETPIDCHGQTSAILMNWFLRFELALQGIRDQRKVWAAISIVEER